MAERSVEQRLVALEARLRAAEDELEILRLLNSYGPLVDSGAGEEAAALWVDGGGYDFGDAHGGGRLSAPDELVSLYESEYHRGLVATGSAHLTGTPRVIVSGDTAAAVGYSFVIARSGDHWTVQRAAVNHWLLVRADTGWRIAERFNRLLDGSPGSHAVMRKVLD
jgi:SnoaL-like domain